MTTFRDVGWLWPTFLHGGKDEHEARQHKLTTFFDQATRNCDDLICQFIQKSFCSFPRLSQSSENGRSCDLSQSETVFETHLNDNSHLRWEKRRRKLACSPAQAAWISEHKVRGTVHPAAFI